MVWTSQPPLSNNKLGRELVESMWIEFAITTIFLIARAHTRLNIVRKVALDDYIMIVSYLVNLAAFILNNLSVNNGFGLHQDDLSPYLVKEVVKWAFLGQVCGIMGSAITRMAFIATLIALLSPSQRLQRWILYAFFAGQVGINSTISLYILLQCRPIKGLWDHTIGAHCLPPIIQEHIGFSQGSINSFTDLGLAIFPATIIWNLNMKRSLKIQLSATMGLGIFACVTAIMKTVKLTEISENPNDLTHIMWGLQFWFVIENCTLIIAATIPTLRPIFTRGRADRRSTQRNMCGQGPSYIRSKSLWNSKRKASVLDTTISGYFGDHIELTSTQSRKFVVGSDTECVAGPLNGDGVDFPTPLGEGKILKTMDATVER